MITSDMFDRAKAHAESEFGITGELEICDDFTPTPENCSDAGEHGVWVKAWIRVPRLFLEQPAKISNGLYFIGASGGKHFYSSLGALIRCFHPELIGKHIFKQLEALDLYDEFKEGVTPFALPFSFSIYDKKGADDVVLCDNQGPKTL